MRRHSWLLLCVGLCAVPLGGCGGNDTYNAAQGSAGGTFRLSAAPSQNSVVLGNTVTYTITATSVGTFDRPVTLSAAGLPPGAVAAFAANPVTPTSGGTDTTLTIDTGGTLEGTIRSVGASRAVYAITVRGVAGGVSAQTTVQLSTQAAGG